MADPSTGIAATLAGVLQNCGPAASANLAWPVSVRVDHSGKISGWAVDRNSLNNTIDVSVYDGATLLTTVPATGSRPDVGTYLGERPARIQPHDAGFLNRRQSSHGHGPAGKFFGIFGGFAVLDLPVSTVQRIPAARELKV
jgi:hypothetical protein